MTTTEHLLSITLGCRTSDVLEVKPGADRSYYLVRVRLEGGNPEGTWGWISASELPDEMKAAR